MFCPQCGAALGEGASGCAACGWSSSRKTLWIVLGSVFALLCILCCGGFAFIGMKFKKAAEEMQEKGTPAILAYHRLSVLNYAKKRGSLPDTLAKAAEEKLVLEDHAADGAAGGAAGDPGDPADPGDPPLPRGKTSIKFRMQENGLDLDSWQRPLRYAPGEAGVYEIRSAGPDGNFDTGDDLTVQGSTDDDLGDVTREFQRQSTAIGRQFMESIGLDPDRVGKEDAEPAPAPPAPAPPAPAPPAPPPPGGGK